MRDRIRNILLETVRSNNKEQILLDYLKKGDGFDPSHYWSEFSLWCPYYDNGSGDITSELEEITGVKISSEEFEEESEIILNKINPSFYYKLSKKIREEFESQLNIEENTKQSFGLLSDTLLPQNTWLVHFTDNAYDILKNGFAYGFPDLKNLGETVRISDIHKSIGGYNFAYLKDQNDFAIQNGAWKRKSSVVFQHSGVHVYHYGDHESQVIFWGKYVDKKNIKMWNMNEE